VELRQQAQQWGVAVRVEAVGDLEEGEGEVTGVEGAGVRVKGRTLAARVGVAAVL